MKDKDEPWGEGIRRTMVEDVVECGESRDKLIEALAGRLERLLRVLHCVVVYMAGQG